MIHLEAVYHRASQQFCYALDEEILMVVCRPEKKWNRFGFITATRFLPVFWAEMRPGKQPGGDRDKNASAQAPLVGNSRAASL